MLKICKTFMTDHEKKPLIGTEGQTESSAKRKKCIKYGVIAAIIVAVIVIIVVVVVVTKKSSKDDDLIENEIEDNPYMLTGGTRTKYSFTAKLNGTGQVQSRGLRANETNLISTELSVSISHLERESGSVRVHISDASKQQYEVSENIVKRPSVDTTSSLEQLGFKNESEPFSFSFQPDANGDAAITTKNRFLLMYPEFLEMGFVVCSQDIFGLGQHSETFKLAESEYTLFANGSSNSVNAHPFLLVKCPDNSFFGMVFINSNA